LKSRAVKPDLERSGWLHALAFPYNHYCNRKHIRLGTTGLPLTQLGLMIIVI